MSKLTQQQRDARDDEVYEEFNKCVIPYVEQGHISSEKALDIYRMVNKEVRLVHDVAPHDARARASSHA